MDITIARNAHPQAGARLEDVRFPPGLSAARGERASDLFLYFRAVVRYARGVAFAVVPEAQLERAPAVRQVRLKRRRALPETQPGKAEHHGLPGLPEAGEVQPLLARVGHHVAQVEPQRFGEVPGCVLV